MTESTRSFFGNMKMFNCLSLSSIHIPYGDFMLLTREFPTQGKEPFLVLNVNDDGWFLEFLDGVDSSSVEDAITRLMEEGYSHAFIRIFRSAIGSKVDSIFLGAEGTVYSDLPKFNWK